MINQERRRRAKECKARREARRWEIENTVD